MSIALPVSPQPRKGEALDSYLERALSLNGHSRAAFDRLITLSGGTGACLPFMVNETTAGHLGALTGLPTVEIHRMTLAGLGEGRPYTWAGFDPIRAATSLRALSSQGWFPAKGSQYCPHCLGAGRGWQLIWRLPYATVCLDHESYLTQACPRCRRPPRLVRSSPFKGFPDRPYLCGNPTGTLQPCPGDLRAPHSPPAPADHSSVQRRLEAALAGAAPPVVGQLFTAEEYLSSLHSLGVLMLYLAREGRSPQREPVTEVRGHEESEIVDGGRWYLKPPTDPAARAEAVSAAEAILTQDTLDDAARLLAVRLEVVRDVHEGRLRWVREHSRLTPLVEAISVRALRGRLSHQLDAERVGEYLPLHSIPQQLPMDLYRRTLEPLLAVTPPVGRVFGALMVARAHPHVNSWSQAARGLNLPPEHGPRTARTVHQRLPTTSWRLQRVTHEISDALDATVDWRAREAAVRELHEDPKPWLGEWLRHNVPGARESSFPYAVTYRWIHEAGGIMATSPAWAHPPSAATRDHYRRFEKRVLARRASQHVLF
ncbi:TniQ family protein [Dermacoccus sp. PAMC28757]|nr:TniQ family protein [Dermacoccus sp. PAMC28757]